MAGSSILKQIIQRRPIAGSILLKSTRSVSSISNESFPLEKQNCCLLSLSCSNGFANTYSVVRNNYHRVFLSTAAKQAETNAGDENVHKVNTKKEKKRVKLSEVQISEVLKAKHTVRWVEPVICRDSTVKEAVVVCIERGLSGMMVVDREELLCDLSREKGKVVGMTTSRDLLRIIAAGLKKGSNAEEVMAQKVGDFMTPISQVIYARPNETIGMCRTVMAKLGVKCLPILANGRVEGLITARDMSDFGLDAKDRGGKKNYLRDVSQRVGLGSETSMAEPPTYLKADLDQAHKPLYVNIGVAELPHPFKMNDGIGMDQREYGARDYSMDPEMSEDAHFVAYAPIYDSSSSSPNVEIYMGVADGVGSWREYGVDPRDFSHRLMKECENIVHETVSTSNPGNTIARLPTPNEVLIEGYNRVVEDNVIGSTTAMVAHFDGIHHQLHFSNLGDSGLIVLRHIDSDIAGALIRDRNTPRVKRKSDLRAAFVSQQQLRSFNHPYQLGHTGAEKDESSSFKSPAEACCSSIHVRRGDIIIMATDGLFDNVDLDDICDFTLAWETRSGFLRHGDVEARKKRWLMGSSMTVLSADVIPDLAMELCMKARENSLDSSTDSPFAILAKENDIMWSGGMPDDCTVVAMHIVGRDAKDTTDAPSGMGE